MILKSDIIQLKNIELNSNELEICRKISENTTNTWQTNRSFEEKLKDTCLGKLAEKSFKLFLTQNLSNFSQHFAFYDDFRNDNFTHHNSIDLLFSSNIENLTKAKKYIQNYMNYSNAKFSDDIKIKFQNNHVNICEIKSTRISNRLIDENNNINFDKLLNDDFLTYPKLTRKSTISKSSEYLDFFSKKLNLTKEQLISEEEKNLLHWYFRVYIHEKNEIGKADVYLIGVIPGIDFINNLHIKKMSKENKSEAALYLSVPLKNGYSLNYFIEEFSQTLNQQNKKLKI